MRKKEQKVKHLNRAMWAWTICNCLQGHALLFYAKLFYTFRCFVYMFTFIWTALPCHATSFSFCSKLFLPHSPWLLHIGMESKTVNNSLTPLPSPLSLVLPWLSSTRLRLGSAVWAMFIAQLIELSYKYGSNEWLMSGSEWLEPFFCPKMGIFFILCFQGLDRCSFHRHHPSVCPDEPQ